MLRLCAFGAFGGLGRALVGDATRARQRERRLAFYNIHTGESVDVVYWADGKYIAEGRTLIDNVLRDHRTGEVKKMDRKLLDLLFALRLELDSRESFHVISGFRSSASNEFLRGGSPRSGVAKKSQHLEGRATDLRLPGRRLDSVREAAIRLGRGGVGYYPKSNFVHVDVARVRYW